MASYDLSTKLRYSHKALADQIIANPMMSNVELGKVFGFSPHWVGRVKNSDLFVEFMQTRRAELIDPMLTATLDERFGMLARRSLEVLMEKMEQPTAAISDDLVLEAAKLGAKAAGVGGFGAKVLVVPQAPDADRIERLAARLEALSGKRVVEVVEEAVLAPRRSVEARSIDGRSIDLEARSLPSDTSRLTVEGTVDKRTLDHRSSWQRAADSAGEPEGEVREKRAYTGPTVGDQRPALPTSVLDFSNRTGV